MLVLYHMVGSLTEHPNRSLDFQILGEMPRIRNVQRKAVALAAYQTLRKNGNTERWMRKVTPESNAQVDMIWCSIRTISGIDGIGYQIESTHLAIILGAEAPIEDIAKSAHHLQGTIVGEAAAVEIDGEKSTTSAAEGDTSMFQSRSFVTQHTGS